jgi:uncharacterized Zn finger protein
MAQTYTIDDIEWQTLVSNVAKHFEEVMIMRGFQYYKQGRVRSLELSNTRFIEADVTGKNTYHVEIHLDQFYNNQCTCPVQFRCKHMIAVLLEYASSNGRPIHDIVNAKMKSMMNRNSYTAIQQEQLAILKQQAAQIPTMTIAEWHQLFEQCSAPFANNTRNDQYINDIAKAVDQIRPSLSDIIECLFNLHMCLFIFEKLVKQTYSGYFTQVAADKVLRTVEQIYTNKLQINTEDEQWQYITDTITYLRHRMLTESPNCNSYFDLYAQLWTHWIHPNLDNQLLYSEELEYLRLAENELSGKNAKLPWMLSQAMMHFYIGQDQQSWELLNAAENNYTIYFNNLLPIYNSLTETEDWSRLVNWLVETGPLLGSNRSHNLNQYMSIWDKVISHLTGAEGHMIDTLGRMLPASKAIYQEALIAHGKWQLWMDYQLSSGIEPLDFYVKVLEPIEKNAPEMLLPFYHQAVERYILQKNRDSYKAAVKLLKRLSKLYKKVKQETRFEQFMSSFASRNSRLRALQEELQKGKLIP